MDLNFKTFAEVVSKTFLDFQRMTDSNGKDIPLFFVEMEKDELWNVYLDSFTPEENPIYLEKREWDCNTCKQFISNVGHVVAIIDGKMVSIWETVWASRNVDMTFRRVSALMNKHVCSKPIANVFACEFKKYGNPSNTRELPSGDIVTFNHFCGEVHRKYWAGDDVGSVKSKAASTKQVLKRALDEFQIEHVQEVLYIASDGSLYRGDQQKKTLESFLKVLKIYKSIPEEDKDNFAWNASITYTHCTNIRSSAIGQLLIDLSVDGLDLDNAVRRYEAMVAPHNYKRSTALVTQTMINKAKETIEALGLTNSLKRTHATLEQLPVTKCLFINSDHDTKQEIFTDAFDGVTATKGSETKNAQDITINEFIKTVIPSAKTVEVKIKNDQLNNLVAITTSSNENDPLLFGWNNPFGWTYKSGTTDSIKERVKAAGGEVNSELCCRLAWENSDDLDLHMVEVDHVGNKYEIYYGSKRSSRTGGFLDIDMNAQSISKHPVENIHYPTIDKMHNGRYYLVVHNYNKRTSHNVGFTVEIDITGELHTFNYSKEVRDKESIRIADLVVKDGVVTVEPQLDCNKGALIKEEWNIKTNTFIPVSAIFTSPNTWDDAEQYKSQKHFFFTLQGCKTNAPIRGVFNEYLKVDLHDHRKVLEIVGTRNMIEPTQNQLCGVGFASTIRNSIVVKTTGTNGTRLYNVTF